MDRKSSKLIGLLAAAAFSCFILANTLYAGAFSKDEVGTTSAQFLKIGCGARAIAMGEAFSSVADDASAIYWNPAGLSLVKTSEVAAMHAVWLEEISYDFLAFAQPMPFGSLGVSINYLSMKGIDKLDDEGAKYGTIKPYDAAVNIAYSKKLIDAMAVGLNLKYIKQELDDETATGFAADLGVISELSEKSKVSFAVQNAGTKMKFIKESYSLPLTLRLGASYKLNKSLLVAVDGVAPIDNDPSAHVGCEYTFNGIESFPMVLRVGYKTTTISDIDAMAGLSGGAGFRVGMLGIDYAWVPYGDLGDTHRISLGMKFGGEVDREVKKRSEKVEKSKVVRKKIIKKKVYKSKDKKGLAKPRLKIK